LLYTEGKRCTEAITKQPIWKKTTDPSYRHSHITASIIHQRVEEIAAPCEDHTGIQRTGRKTGRSTILSPFPSADYGVEEVLDRLRDSHEVTRIAPKTNRRMSEWIPPVHHPLIEVEDSSLPPTTCLLSIRFAEKVWKVGRAYAWEIE